jgi:hypothetical protein
MPLKKGQIERLSQLGELREKGLLTDEEFASQKAIVMGDGEVEHAEPGTASRRFGRSMVALSVALSGVALYFALDARSRARTEAEAVRAEVPLHPKLVIQDASTGFQDVPGDGYRHNVEANCNYPSVALGGGFAPELGSGQPTIIASFPDTSQWLVGAANESGKRTRVSVTATCAHGEGGLAVEAPPP